MSALLLVLLQMKRNMSGQSARGPRIAHQVDKRSRTWSLVDLP